jgi:hypothetical protein
MVRLLFWGLAIYIAVMMFALVVFAVLSVVVLVVAIRLIVWACQSFYRWANRPRALPTRPGFVTAPYAPRPTPEQLLRAEVAQIIELRGEGRFIAELDEKLGNPPDPAYVPTPYWPDTPYRATRRSR